MKRQLKRGRFSGLFLTVFSAVLFPAMFVNACSQKKTGVEPLSESTAYEALETTEPLAISPEETSAAANENITAVMDYIHSRQAMEKTADSGEAEDGSDGDQMYDITGIREKDAREFLKNFVDHVSADEKEDASRMISFPKKVILPDREVIVQNAEEFSAYYDEIFTEEYKKRLSQLLEEDSIWWNYQGVAIGNGELWINEAEGVLTVTSLNGAEDRMVIYPGEPGVMAE